MLYYNLILFGLAKRGVRTFPNDLHDQKNKSKPKNSREQKGEKGSSSAGEKDTTQGFELKKPSTEDGTSI